MRKKKAGNAISVLLVAAVLLYPFASFGVPVAKDIIVLKAGPLKGTLMDAAGNHLANVRIEVLDMNGKLLTSTVTDKAGKFALKDMGPGRFMLRIGDDYSLKLALEEGAEGSEMKVVVPGEPAEKLVAGRFTVTQLVIGGIVVAVIGGAAAAAGGGGGGGGGGTVSP